MKLPQYRVLRSRAKNPSQSTLLVQDPCEAVWDLLSLYADNEATRDEAAIVETHIAACHDCARDLSFLRASHTAMSGLPEVSPPISLRASILASTVHKPSIGRRISVGIHHLLAPAPARYGFAIAAGLAGVMVAVGISRGIDRSGGIVENPAAYRSTRGFVQSDPSAQFAPGIKSHSAPVLPDAVSHPDVGPVVRAKHGSGPATFASSHAPAALRIRSGQGSGLASVRVLKDAAAGRRTTLPAPVLVAGGEMKLKAPTIDRQPLPADEEVAQTADMTVMADPTPVKPESQPVKSPETVVPDPAPAAAPSRSGRYLLTSNSTPDNVGQIATFADLKRSLKHRDVDGDRAIEQSLKAREIRLPVLRRTF